MDQMTASTSVPTDFAAEAISRDALRRIVEIGEKVDYIEKLLEVNPGQVRSFDRKWLTPKEFSEALAIHGPSHRQMVPDTVRGNCNNSRLNCVKSGWRGKHQLWLLPVEEVRRFIDEGLLPNNNGFRHPR